MFAGVQIRIDSEYQKISLSVKEAATMLVPSQGRGAGLELRAEFGRTQHQLRQSELKKRYRDYNGEFQIQSLFHHSGYDILIKGRPDAVYTEKGKTIIEEIKTIALDSPSFNSLRLDAFANFQVQLDLYAYLFNLEKGDEVQARLFLLNLATAEAKILDYLPDFNALKTDLERLFLLLITEVERLKLRDLYLSKSAEQIEFPYPQLRTYQKEMMESVIENIEEKGTLLLSAPTGTGKTAGVLFPAIINALKLSKRVYFATARNTQRLIVRDFILKLKEQNAPFSALFLTARAKLCPLNCEVCQWSDCHYLTNFHTSFSRTTLVKEMEEGAVFTGEEIAQRLLPMDICPFIASLKLAERADIIVGDYNYVFDPSIALRNLFSDDQASEFILVVDEAHNLPNRIRERFSPFISLQVVQELLSGLKSKSFTGEIFVSIAKFLRKVFRLINKYSADLHKADIDLNELSSLRAQADDLAINYYLFLTRYSAFSAEDPLLGFLQEFNWFCRVAEMGKAGFALHYYPERQSLQVHCLDSGQVLRPVISKFYSVIAMSATLHPVEYFSSSLGLHENAKVLNLPNPFPAENRFIGVIPTVSTRYQLRKQFHRPIAEIIDRIFEIHPGSYLCFFSSFEQLSAVHTHLNSPCLAQKPNMNEIEREGFLARISDGSGKLGLAVLGGIFAEGIDLPGSLDGVIVVGPGLPLYCPETEFQRAYYDEIYGDGFLYAYAYPGMNRVVQAAGRLIRNETDRGLIILLDARFNREPYRSLLPCDWYIEHPSELVIKDLEAELTRFWVSL